MSHYFYGPARKVLRPHEAAAQRPPEPHRTVSSGRIAKLFVGQGYGFISTANSRVVYFHRTDLRRGTSMNHLRVSDRVIFELVDDNVSGARAACVARAERRA